jgi:dihydrofolate synthase/folylpolyglutamate synthase
MPLPAAAAEALAGLEMFGVRLGLVRMRRLLAALGDPQRRVPAVLVAGSNGKGSTAALLAAMAAAAGYRTGLYTSPHLERVEERLRIDGRPVDGGRLGRWILEVLDAAGRVLDEPPTYFETLTAAAFAELAAAEVELAVVEVGLGGRLDATNLAEPALSLVTPISLEHREHLGDTLGAIAVEKAGVMRAGRPTVAWTAEPEVAAALGRAAREAGAGLVMGPEGVEIVGVEPRGAGEEGFWSGQRIELGTARGRYRCDTPLLGAHQARNLAHAALAAEMLAGLDPGRGQGRGHGWGRIDAAAIERGAAEVDWPGRLEPVALPALGAKSFDDAAGETASGGENALGERRLPRRALLDVAHNPGGATELAAFLDTLPPLPSGAPRTVDLLFGILGDKDAAGTLGPLLPHVRRAVLTRPPHARGRNPGELPALLSLEVSGRDTQAPSEIPAGGDSAGPQIEIEPDPEAALDRALAPPPGTEPADTLLVCGSLYLVGAARGSLRRRFGGS